MTSYDIAPSVEVFCSPQHDFFDECNNSVSGHRSPVTVVSSFDLETVRSYPGITANSSMHSFTSEWSTVTTQISNTTKRQSEVKQRKRKFVHFVKILLGIVKEKDEGRFRNAKAVICDCEQQKRRGEIESMSESLRYPLKDAVGTQLWSEARQRMSQSLSHSMRERSSLVVAKESACNSLLVTSPIEQVSASPIEQVATSSIEQVEVYGRLGSSTMLKSESSTKTTKTTKIKEMGIRKKRLWMIIRVFMQYLRSKHCHLYRKAHTLVNECVRQHRRVQDFGHCSSLSGSIQACLKKEFGFDHWKRAEYFVADILLTRHEYRS